MDARVLREREDEGVVSTREAAHAGSKDARGKALVSVALLRPAGPVEQTKERSADAVVVRCRRAEESETSPRSVWLQQRRPLRLRLGK